jgi:hypothetical protein
MNQELSRYDHATLKRVQSMIARGVLVIANDDAYDDPCLSIRAIKVGRSGVASIRCQNADIRIDYNHKHYVPINVAL